MDEVIKKKEEALGAEGSRGSTEATPAGNPYRPGSLSNVVLQLEQQNT